MTLTVRFLFYDIGISNCELPVFRRGVDQVFTLQGPYAIYPRRNQTSASPIFEQWITRTRNRMCADGMNVTVTTDDA